jgi:N,N'-diacetyllegionaminate synthase
MSDLKEISEALGILLKAGTCKENITILHCNTEYPTPMKDANLLAMLTIRDTFGVSVGYSDHTLGIEVPIAAVALGATVIEKHFTLDRTMPGPDHQASLEPDELKEMVNAIRNIEQALGNGIKKPSASEQINRLVVRKSIVATRDIKRHEVFSDENLAVKRPGTGLNPMLWNKILGKKAKRDFKKDELIEI